MAYRGGTVLAQDSRRDRSPNLRTSRRNVGQSDVLLHRRPEGPAGDVPDDLARRDDLMSVPCHAAVDHQTDDPALRSFSLDGGDRITADERLVELARPAEPGLHRIRRPVDGVAGTRESRLGA